MCPYLAIDPQDCRAYVRSFGFNSHRVQAGGLPPREQFGMDPAFPKEMQRDVRAASPSAVDSRGFVKSVQMS